MLSVKDQIISIAGFGLPTGLPLQSKSSPRQRRNEPAGFTKQGWAGFGPGQSWLVSAFKGGLPLGLPPSWAKVLPKKGAQQERT